MSDTYEKAICEYCHKEIIEIIDGEEALLWIHKEGRKLMAYDSVGVIHQPKVLVIFDVVKEKFSNEKLLELFK